eukprot:TRINITY_DN12147_c0_g4_i3.p1 TRINITY_DN12147_c0_g4~~TRINITY_DN12147_c0_g4_i3.p1  ORF type:complete len:378 (+),score=95.22 TRINITY_DN12147_c0_g4_i3:261-1394(+)
MDPHAAPHVGGMPSADGGVMKDPDALKLFVGQIPREYSEDELTDMFAEFGDIYEVMVLRDRATGQSKGCAFLTFTARQAALDAIQRHHEVTTLPGMGHPMQVKVADSDQRGEDRKLFIGMISRDLDEDSLRAMFAPFGDIDDLTILKNPEGVSRGCAFVKYQSAADAQRAIEALHHSKTMEGCRSPMVVKIADTERQKQQRRAQKQFQYNMMMPYMQMARGMPPAYGMYGQAPFGSPQMYGGAPEPDMNGGGYQPYGGQYGMPPPGPGGFEMPGYMHAPPPRQSSQREGPPGANLFIYHLPQEFNDSALASTFMPFGNVISAKVFVDKFTGQSKCFGFVSYDDPTAASTAITAMNGFQIGMKRLKVQLKRPKHENAF